MAKGNKEVIKSDKKEAANINEQEEAKNDKKVAETKAITSDAITESDNKKTGTKNLNKTINDLQKKLDNCTKDLTDLINENNDKTIAPTANQTESEEDANSMTNILEFFNLYKSNENYKNVELFKRLIKKEGKTLADKKQQNDNINRKNIAKNSQHEQINHLIKQISDMGKCIEALKIENMNAQEFYEHLKKRMLENDATVEDVLLFHAKNSINPLESDEKKMKKIFNELADYLNDLSVQGIALEEAKKQYNEDLINKFLQLYGELSDEQKNIIKCRLASALGESVFANEDKKTEKNNDNKPDEKVYIGKESTTTKTPVSEDEEDSSDDTSTTTDEKTEESEPVISEKIADNEAEITLYHGTLTQILNETDFNKDLTEEEKDKIIERGASYALCHAIHNTTSQAKQENTEGKSVYNGKKKINKIQAADDTTEQNNETTGAQAEVPVAAEPFIEEPEPVVGAQGQAVVPAVGAQGPALEQVVGAEESAAGAQGPAVVPAVCAVIGAAELPAGAQAEVPVVPAVGAQEPAAGAQEPAAGAQEPEQRPAALPV